MRNKTMRVMVAGALSAGVLGLMPAPAMAEETTCRGSMGQRTVDNVKVPQGATCILEGTTVKGTVYVNNNATLKAIDVRVNGNVQGENARRVVVRGGSVVDGSVQVVQGGTAKVAGSRIGSDILFDSQNGNVIAKGNKVGGNISAFQNKGGVKIAGNNVDGNLQCKTNSPRPTGGNNTVQGEKEDQCKSL